MKAQPNEEVIDQVSLISLNELPPLPSQLRYYDDFEDKTRSLTNLKSSDTWLIQVDGENRYLDFAQSHTNLKDLNKHIAVSLLSRLDTANAIEATHLAIRSEKHILSALLKSAPDFRDYWIREVYTELSAFRASQLRTCIHALCDIAVGGWNPDLKGFVSQLPTARIDIYKTVRSGECFIPLEDQSKIIGYIDEFANLCKCGKPISFEDARDICLLTISHQYGFRPGQIARIRLSDVATYKNGAVHLSIPLLKQRGVNRLTKVTRKVKQEWAPIFSEYLTLRDLKTSGAKTPGDSLFLLTPKEVGRRIVDLSEELTGNPWTATDMRHTAAQRLADAGSSRISIAEFMGHRSILTAGVYIDASPNQAQRINQALGISPIYSTLAEAARKRMLSPQEILRYSEEQQISAVPHGIPISGIGACQVGQPNCANDVPPV